MIHIPPSLAGAFADVGRQIVDAWWASLAPEARDEIARLCDDRLDACFFGVVADEGEQTVPKVHGGRFIPPDQAWGFEGFEEWAPDYFDHLMEHPELVLIYDPTLRKFHTGCTRHAAARACWAAGSVPRAFACPFENAACLMHPLRDRPIRRRMPRCGSQPARVALKVFEVL